MGTRDRYWLAINPGGEIDYRLARNVPIGIQSVITEIEEIFPNSTTYS